MAFNPWAGFGQQQFPPGFGGFGGVPQFWGPDQGMYQMPPQFGGPQPWLPDQGINQAPPPQRPSQGGGPQLGGVGGAPVGGGGAQYPDWFIQAGQQNGMNPRQMEVEWQRFMQSQGGGPMRDYGIGSPESYANSPRRPDGGGQAPNRFRIGPNGERIEFYAPEGSIGTADSYPINPGPGQMARGGGGRQPDMGGGSGPFGGPQAPPMYSGNSEVPRGGYGRFSEPRQFDPSRTGGPRGNEGGKMGPGGGPQVGMIGGSPVSDFNSSGYLAASGKSNAAPEGKAAGSGKWQYHANGSRTWKPNKPKPTKKPPTTTRPPVVVKPGPDGGPTPQPSPSANNDTVPSTSNKPPVANTPPIYVPGSEMRQSSGSMPSLAASLNKRRPG